MPNLLTKTDNYITKKLWDIDLTSSGRLRSFVVKLLRLVYLFVLELSEEQLAMRSMSLVYTSLLAIVPLLAVSFSILKAFGVHTKLLIMLYYFLEPLGPQGIDLSLKIIEFVENVKISVIGSIGLALLIYTVMSEIHKIESALNYIWNVKNSRGFAKRFNNYLSILLVGPVLVFSLAGVITSISQLGFLQKLTKIETLGPLLVIAGKFMPYLIVSAVFTFIYKTLPNTKVFHARGRITGKIFSNILGFCDLASQPHLALLELLYSSGRRQGLILQPVSNVNCRKEKDFFFKHKGQGKAGLKYHVPYRP